MNSGGLPPARVVAAIATDWGVTTDSLTPIQAGMNSQTWLVEAGGHWFVAKAVPHDRADSFEAGLAIATIVERAGIRTGAPLPTSHGRSCVRVGDTVLALLRFVEGAELTGESVEQRALIGSTLGRVHLALAGHVVATATRFHWLDGTAPHLTIRPWVRPAVEAAVTVYDGIPPESLRWGLLHIDPAPEAFRLDPTTGDCGLIDWGLGVVGPLLYDLAAAEKYVGGPANSRPLIDAYLSTGALTAEEIDRALQPMALMRWAVQADYFATRIAIGDLTGIDDVAENEKRLEEARRALIDRWTGAGQPAGGSSDPTSPR